MEKHPSNQSLQTTAIFALGSMVSKSELSRATVLRNGGIGVIIKAMKQSTKESKSAPLRISELAFAVRSPEPVLYSPQTEKLKCPKPVLLQLFGSVALLNLSESSECKSEIIKLGGIQRMFEASNIVKESKDLWYIVYYIFTKFCNSNDSRSVYMRPIG